MAKLLHLVKGRVFIKPASIARLLFVAKREPAKIAVVFSTNFLNAIAWLVAGLFKQLLLHSDWSLSSFKLARQIMLAE